MVQIVRESEGTSEREEGGGMEGGWDLLAGYASLSSPSPSSKRRRSSLIDADNGPRVANDDDDDGKCVTDLKPTSTIIERNDNVSMFYLNQDITYVSTPPGSFHDN